MGENRAELLARRRGVVVDVLLALAVLAFTIPPTLIGHPVTLIAASQPVQVIAGAVAAATMLVRRRTAWPMIAASLACALVTGELVPVTLAAYSMTAEDRVRRWPWAAGGMALVYMAVDYVSPYTDRLIYLVVVHAVTLVLLPALVGTWVRDHQRMLRELRAGVRASEERAAAQERRRIAGELHDSVTHAVTVMVLNAGLIQDTEDPDEIRKLATNIEDKGVRALTELRELLTALRRKDVPPSAEGIEGIPQLVEDGRATGLRAALHLDAPPGELPREVEHACYRIVQEGLNNVRKHAPGSDVQVTCEVVDGVAHVSGVKSGVTRPAPAGTACPEAVRGAGYGLAGLRERITLLGGALCYGPTPDGGFALSARIPVRRQEPDEVETTR